MLVDFYLADKICELGGWVIFDDVLMPSIQRVIAFILSNRADYEPHPCSVVNVGVFRKIGEDRRDWRHYVAF